MSLLARAAGRMNPGLDHEERERAGRVLARTGLVALALAAAAAGPLQERARAHYGPGLAERLMERIDETEAREAERALAQRLRLLAADHAALSTRLDKAAARLDPSLAEAMARIEADLDHIYMQQEILLGPAGATPVADAIVRRQVERAPAPRRTGSITP
jgi:hypothetical protein